MENTTTLEQKLKQMEVYLEEFMANLTPPTKEQYTSGNPKDHKAIDRFLTLHMKIMSAVDKYYSFKLKYEKMTLALQEKREKMKKKETIKEDHINQELSNIEATDEEAFHDKMDNLSRADKISNVQFYELVKIKDPDSIYSLKKRMLNEFKMLGIEKKCSDISYEECEKIADFYIENIKIPGYTPYYTSEKYREICQISPDFDYEAYELEREEEEARTL